MKHFAKLLVTLTLAAASLFNPLELTPCFAASITVYSPNGGETWIGGNRYDIFWDTSGVNGNVRVELYKAGEYQITIANSVPADSGTCSWQISPLLANGNDYKVRVTSSKNSRVWDESNSYFTISQTPIPKSITVYSPNGGENWAGGGSYDIFWETTGISGNVKVELYKSGALQTTIASSVSADSGTCPWLISTGIPAGSDYKVRVTSLSSPSIWDESNGNFSITQIAPGAITVTSPNGYESWAGGSTYNISWTASGISGNVSIALEKAGTQLAIIAPSVPASNGTYPWQISQLLPAGNDYGIRVISLANPSVWDESDWEFAIVQAQQKEIPWAMFMHDRRHTGRSPYLGPQAAKVKWAFQSPWGGAFFASPIIDPEGTIYIGYSSIFHAINADGTEKWNASGPFGSEEVRISGTAAMNSRYEIFVPALFSVLSFDVYGNLLDEMETGNEGPDVQGGLIIDDANSTIFFPNNNGISASLSAVRVSPLDLVWQRVFPGGDWNFSTPAIGNDGTIYQNLPQGLIALYPGGATKWEFSEPGSFSNSSPTVGDDGTIYFVSYYHDLYAVNPDGTKKWNMGLIGEDQALTSPAIDPGGRVIFASAASFNSSYVYSVDTNKNVTPGFPVQIDGIVASSPCIGKDGTIYIASITNLSVSDPKSVVYAIGRDGTIKWQYEINSLNILSSPAIGPDGTLYLATFDGKIYAFQAEATPVKISQIKPVQVVWDVDINGDGKIDLVSDKPTAILVVIDIDPNATNGDDLIEIKLTIDMDEYFETKSVKQLQQDRRVVFYPDLPSLIGDKIIKATVYPVNDSSGSYDEFSIEVSVKDTNLLKIGYIPLYGPFLGSGYGPLNMEQFSLTVETSNTFIRQTFPISEKKFSGLASDFKYLGNPAKCIVTLPEWPICSGMVDDIFSIWIWGKLDQKLSRADRYVGLVPPDYFAYHNLPDVNGFSNGISKNMGVVLAEAGSMGYAYVAHELGHTYGLPVSGGEEYLTNPPYGKYTNAFSVEKKDYIQDAVCFMGNNDQKQTQWIDKEDYEQLFREFRIEKTDPDILLLSGLIDRNGAIELNKSYILKSADYDSIQPGDYSVVFFGFNGEMIGNIPFLASFEWHLDPIGSFEANYAAFALGIPYPKEAFKVQVQYGGNPLIEINTNIKLLHDMIDSIPSYGFTNNPEERRNSMHNKIDALEKMIEQGDFPGAINKLEFDIKDKIEKWLIDGYQKETPTLLSKDESMALIVEVTERLRLKLR